MTTTTNWYYVKPMSIIISFMMVIVLGLFHFTYHTDRIFGGRHLFSGNSFTNSITRKYFFAIIGNCLLAGLFTLLAFAIPPIALQYILVIFLPIYSVFLQERFVFFLVIAFPPFSQCLRVLLSVIFGVFRTAFSTPKLIPVFFYRTFIELGHRFYFVAPTTFFIHRYLQNKKPFAMRDSASQKANLILTQNRLLSQTISNNGIIS